jgi:hypothetical protein
LSDQAASLVEQAQAALLFMKRLLDSQQHDQFIRAESAFYMKFIRAIETHEHHDTMFRMLEPLVIQYGERVRRQVGVEKGGSVGDSVCYFLPSLDNDLAHIELLSNILRSRSDNKSRRFFIAGFSESGTAIRSRNITQLAREHGISVIALKSSHQALIDFSRWFLSNGIGLLVHYSIPTMLPVWVEVLGPHRVAWYITKFELESFRNLKYGISGVGTKYEIIRRERVSWYRAPAALPQSYLFDFVSTGRGDIQTVTVNREEKIKNPDYLHAITTILHENPGVHFSWTGRDHDRFIVESFKASGLASRNKFLGWVNHVELLPRYDIFLDTFGLSGMVAASAFSSGMPTLFMRNSGTWLESFEEEIVDACIDQEPDIESRISSVLADSPEDYLSKATKLIDAVREGRFTGCWQKDIGMKWFFDSNRAFQRHERAINEILFSSLV